MTEVPISNLIKDFIPLPSMHTCLCAYMHEYIYMHTHTCMYIHKQTLNRLLAHDHHPLPPLPIYQRLSGYLPVPNGTLFLLFFFLFSSLILSFLVSPSPTLHASVFISFAIWVTTSTLGRLFLD